MGKNTGYTYKSRDYDLTAQGERAYNEWRESLTNTPKKRALYHRETRRFDWWLRFSLVKYILLGSIRRIKKSTVRGGWRSKSVSREVRRSEWYSVLTSYDALRLPDSTIHPRRLTPSTSAHLQINHSISQHPSVVDNSKAKAAP